MCLDGIIEYENFTFTNKGQSDVDGFEPKLSAMSHRIIFAASEAKKLAKKFRVIYGFHGDPNGKYFISFDADEIEKSKTIANKFDNIEMIYMDGKNQALVNFEPYIDEGFVLFTWCDSNNFLTDKYPGKLKKPK